MIKIREELKKIKIENEEHFNNVWELLKWYDVEQEIEDLFESGRRKK